MTQHWFLERHHAMWKNRQETRKEARVDIIWLYSNHSAPITSPLEGNMGQFCAFSSFTSSFSCNIVYTVGYTAAL